LWSLTEIQIRRVTGHTPEGDRFEWHCRSVARRFDAHALVFALASPALARHPFAAEYDANKPVMVSGTIERFEWISPQSFVYVDGKNESGKSGTWKVELGSPKALTDGGRRPVACR